MSPSLETQLLLLPHKDAFRASNPPLYQTTTFKQDLASDNPYDYTRLGNPTRSVLEQHLAALMGAHKALVVGSGMLCLDVVMRLVAPGAHVVAGTDLYGGTHRLLTFLDTKGAIQVNHVDTSSAAAVRGAVRADTAMVILESPTNPLLRIVDLPQAVKDIRKIAPKCVIVFDNTMMTPLLCRPLEIGVDIVYELATKYLNGHHDIMAGVLATKRPDLAEQLYFVINATGSGLAPFDCWLLMRGLKTLLIRLERQQRNAMVLAEFLEGKGFKVHYPGLKSHPQYDLHHLFNKGAGAVLSFETGDVSYSEKIVERVRLFSVTVSFGCVNLLISMPCRMSHASIDKKTREERALPEDLVRVCVGIEGVEDLVKDLAQALAQERL